MLGNKEHTYVHTLTRARRATWSEDSSWSIEQQASIIFGIFNMYPTITNSNDNNNSRNNTATFEGLFFKNQIAVSAAQRETCHSPLGQTYSFRCSWPRRGSKSPPSTTYAVFFRSYQQSTHTYTRKHGTTRRRLARERKRWCYSSRKYDDLKITDEIFQCNFKMRKTERKKSERETYRERERRDLQTCKDVDLQMWDDVDLQMWDDVALNVKKSSIPKCQELSIRCHFYLDFSMKMLKKARYPNVKN